MNTDKLIDMANQITSFFRSYPDDEARAGIRDHLESFWTLHMRQAILSEVTNARLDPLVSGALQASPTAESPILKETAGPERGGDLASDAG